MLHHIREHCFKYIKFSSSQLIISVIINNFLTNWSGLIQVWSALSSDFFVPQLLVYIYVVTCLYMFYIYVSEGKNI